MTDNSPALGGQAQGITGNEPRLGGDKAINPVWLNFIHHLRRVAVYPEQLGDDQQIIDSITKDFDAVYEDGKLTFTDKETGYPAYIFRPHPIHPTVNIP